MKVSKRYFWLLALVSAVPPGAGQTPAQLDVRFRDTPKAENQKQEFVRFTMLPGAWFVDAIHVRNGNEFSARYAAGPRVVKTTTWDLYLAGSVSPGANKSLFLGQGLQAYWVKKSGRLPVMKLAAPVLEFYQDRGKNQQAKLGLKENEQLFVFITPRFAVSQETFINKPFGAKVNGYYALAANAWPDNKLMLEAGAFRSLKGEWMLRVRLVFNFSLGRNAASLTN